MSSAATCSSPTQVSPPLLPLPLPLTAVPFDVLIVICLYSDPLQGTYRYYSRRLSMLRERTEAGRQSAYVHGAQNERQADSTHIRRPAPPAAIRLTCRLLYDAHKEAAAEARRQYDAMRKRLMYPYWRHVVEENAYRIHAAKTVDASQLYVNPCGFGNEETAEGDKYWVADMSNVRGEWKTFAWMPSNFGRRYSSNKKRLPPHSSCAIPYLCERPSQNPLEHKPSHADTACCTAGIECNVAEHYIMNTLRLTLPHWEYHQRYSRSQSSYDDYDGSEQPTFVGIFDQLFSLSERRTLRTDEQGLISDFHTDLLLSCVEAFVGAHHREVGEAEGDPLYGVQYDEEVQVQVDDERKKKELNENHRVMERLMTDWQGEHRDFHTLFRTPSYARRTVVELLLMHDRPAFWAALAIPSDFVFCYLVVPSQLLLILTGQPELCPTDEELKAAFPATGSLSWGRKRKLDNVLFSSGSPRKLLPTFLRQLRDTLAEDQGWIEERAERVDNKLTSVGQVAAQLLQFFVENYFVELVRRGEPTLVQQLLPLLLEYGQCHGAEEAKTSDHSDRKDTGSWIRATKGNCVHCKTIRVVYGCIVESGHYNHREEPGTLSHALKRCGSHRVVGALVTFALRVVIGSPELRPYVELPLWEQYLSPFYELLQGQEQEEDREPSGPSCSSSGSFRTGRQLKRERGVLKRIPNELLEEARARARCVKAGGET